MATARMRWRAQEAECCRARPFYAGAMEARIAGSAQINQVYDDVPPNAQPCLDRVLKWLDREHLQQHSKRIDVTRDALDVVTRSARVFTP